MLLDTCVVSEFTKLDGQQHVKDVVDQVDANDLFLSVITVGELRKGVELLPAGPKRRGLEYALAELTDQFGNHILPVDQKIAEIWGVITAQSRLNGVQLATADGLIAATAMSRGLTVMTRNVKDFQPTGVLLVNPWE